MPERGSLVVFEGVDGAGKSTQLTLLARALREGGHPVVETAEPYVGGEWGPRIREMARSGRALPPEEELRWFVEQRREHVREVIGPALAEGRIVLSDRYYLSTVAYQGARGLDPDDILARSEAEFPVPDLVLLLDLDPAAGLSRVQGRGGAGEPVFERRSFQERVREVFGRIERDYLERIDASGGIEAIHGAVVEVVRRRLGLLS